MSLSVTRVKIDSYEPKSTGICAEVTVVLEDEIAIHKVAVIQGERGIFVAMPNTGVTRLVNNNRRYEDLVHPLSTALNDAITEAVLKEYSIYKKQR